MIKEPAKVNDLAGVRMPLRRAIQILFIDIAHFLSNPIE